MSEPLLAGRILKPHGIHGELRVEIISDFPQRFRPGAMILIAPPEGGDSSMEKVVAVRPHGDRLLLRLEGVEDRTGAEQYRGMEIYFPAEAIVNTDPSFHYLHDLEGLPARLPGGEPVGVVTGFEEGGQLILVIARPGKPDALVPFVKELVEVRRGEEVIIHPIPGLLAER